MTQQTISSLQLPGLKFVSLHDTDGTAFYLKQAGMVEIHNPEEADIIVFNGGEDIATELYGEKPVMRRIPRVVSTRDQDERYVFEKYSAMGKFFLGICRGAQLLNVLNGGKLWQHVNNHGLSHPITDSSGDTYIATSTHHQMMRPGKLGEVIATALEATAKMADGVSFEGSQDRNVEADVEIVWYKGNRTLCIQGHPEYVPGSEFANYCLKLIKDHYNEQAT